MKKQFIALFLILIQSCGSSSNQTQKPSQSSQSTPTEEVDSSPIERVESTIPTPTIPNTPPEVITPIPQKKTPVFVLKSKGIINHGWNSWVGSGDDAYCLMTDEDHSGTLKAFHPNALSREQVVDSLKFPLDITRNILLFGSLFVKYKWLGHIAQKPEYLEFITNTQIEAEAKYNQFLNQKFYSPSEAFNSRTQILWEKWAQDGKFLRDLRYRDGQLIELGLSIAFYGSFILWTYGWVSANLDFDDITSQNTANWNPSDLETLSATLKTLTPETSLSCQ